MRSVLARSLASAGTLLAGTAAATIAFVAVTPAAYAQETTEAGTEADPKADPEAGLEEIVVTATRREANLQTIPVAVSAYTGKSLAENKVFSTSDLANAVPSFSYTAFTPLDQELNIRGVTNTRLDSPSADPSVGTFIDGVYLGRTGEYNFDFFDLERIEVIRGPQGVLLGKNVVGGALSVITAAPSQETSAELTLSAGNYKSRLLTGHVNGAITDTLSGRVAFQYRAHDGYAKDILHDRDLEDLDSKQARAQLLWQPGDGWRIRGIFDYTDDRSNGHNSVAVDGGIKDCETSVLRSNCTRPWSNARAYLGLTNPREGMPWSPELAEEGSAQDQYLTREGWGATLDVAKDMGFATFNSLTGYRKVHTNQVFSQTAMGPAALGWSVPQWLAYVAFVNAKYGPRAQTSNRGEFLFELANAEETHSKAFSQEFRLTSNTDGRFDWIVGAYYKRDTVDKVDRFIGENFFGAFANNQPTPNPLSTTSGQSNWYNNGVNKNYAVFGQLGFKFTDTVKLTVGLRQTWDEKGGDVQGLVVATGDRFNPNDPRAVVAMESLCRSPSGAVVTVPSGGQCLAPNHWVYAEGEGFQTPYSEKWNELTPQATLGWNVTDDVYTYLTYAQGFKGGGFDDTPSNPGQATNPFDPEKVKNYEFGIKSMFWDRRVRLNADVFYMDYKNLQVIQTNPACLCNLTDNAASAEIKGVEAELDFLPVDSLRLSLSGSYVDATYKDFLESAIDPNTGQRLDSSGNKLQRTPATQVAAGINYQLGIVNFDARYSWQSSMFWGTDNVAKEPSYGLLDARVSIGPESERWAVAVWAKNLTDKLYRTNVIPFFGDEVSQFGPPRTYGLDVTFRY
jgi:iron complex outermembrane receptor protein